MVSFDPGYPRRRLSGHLAWFLLWLVVTAIALWLSPHRDGHGTHQQLGLPPCPSVFLFGRLCPGCGLTTSFTALVHGDLVTAWRANAFGVLGYIGFTLSAWACLYGFVKEMRFNTDSKPCQFALGAFIVSYLAFGVWRITTISVPKGVESINSMSRD